MAIKKTKVEVYGETSKYERSMRNVKRTSKSTSQSISSHWSKTFGTLTKLSAAFGIAGAAGFVALGKKALDTADAIGKTADKIGIGTDALQEYQYAAELSGIEQATLNSGLEAFTKRLGEAQVGTGALVTYLNNYNEVLLANIQASGSTEEALGYIFEAMGNMTDASDRAALSAAAFGRTAGIDMTILVREGTAGLEQMRQKARDLGLVIDESLIRESEEANDALATLMSMVSIQMTSALISLAPEITKVTQNMTDWVKANQQLIDQKVETVINGIATSVEAIVGAYNKLPEGVIGATGVGILGRLLTGSTPIGVFLASLVMIDKYVSKWSEAASTYHEMRALEEKGLEQMRIPPEQRGKPFFRAPMPPYPETPEIPAVPGPVGPRGEVESYQQITDELLGASELRGEQMRELQMIQDELLAEQYMEQAQASLEAKSEMEIYMTDKLYHDLDAMGWQHYQTMEDLAKKEKALQMAKLATYQGIAAGVANTFLQISQAGGKQSEEAFRLYQAFSIVEAGIATALAIVKTLGQFGWFGIPLSIIIGAMGAAQIAMIASAKPPSYDLGGISTTPGMYYSGVPEAHVPLKSGAIPVDLNAGRGAGDTFIIMENPVFQDVDTQRQIFAQIAEVIVDQRSPQVWVRSYDDDTHGIRNRVRNRP